MCHYSLFYKQLFKSVVAFKCNIWTIISDFPCMIRKKVVLVHNSAIERQDLFKDLFEISPPPPHPYTEFRNQLHFKSKWVLAALKLSLPPYAASAEIKALL